jgi:hypothetical protein
MWSKKSHLLYFVRRLSAAAPFAVSLLCMPAPLLAQHEHDSMKMPPPVIRNIEAQPLLAQAIRLDQALTYLGSPLSAADSRRLKELTDQKPGPNTAGQIQNILDPYCIAAVTINPEERVSVDRGAARPGLVQGGWRSFLVKVYNQAGVRTRLQVHSANAEPLLYGSANAQHASPAHALTPGQVAGRFVEMAMYHDRPLEPELSGLALEYAVVQIYCKDKGPREIELGFNVGQGSRDIGFRSSIHLLVEVRPSVKVKLLVRDEDGSPAMASLTIKDGMGHIYPLPSRRLAAVDAYPDLFFEPQVYRTSGEYVGLPAGHYSVTYTRGPEYLVQHRELVVPEGTDSMETSFQLKRWTHLAALGWYSGDHHVHAAGCSHYESPEEGVRPAAMFRQVQGEDLNVAALLSWGPGWYYQKNFFTGAVHPLSTRRNIIRYDVEVSGFPSSHAGHLDLLGLSEDDYPGTTTIEDWPSWTLPVLQWAKKQGATTGYAHSGWGLQPMQPTLQLPNYVMPKMDGIGANEYIVTVTQNVVDLYSAGDTPAPWELNMWYHTLNCGFRPRLSGETDFPCIFDERVGIARSYFRPSAAGYPAAAALPATTAYPDTALSYPTYLEALKQGRSYVSDGRSHLPDLAVNGLQAGARNSELALDGAQTVNITASAAAFLPAQQDEAGAAIARLPMDQSPYWHIERARVGTTRKVPVELIVNGEPADTQQIVADGRWQQLRFTYTVRRSCWIALRILPSSHTNPVFILLDHRPIDVRKSAEWCRQAVDRCWEMKRSNIRTGEIPAATSAYDHARTIYEKLIREGK